MYNEEQLKTMAKKRITELYNQLAIENGRPTVKCFNSKSKAVLRVLRIQDDKQQDKQLTLF